MKHSGCVLAFTAQRNKELMTAYRNAILNADYIDLSRVAYIIANTPTSRFWVSEERALIVVQAIMNGSPILETMRPLKREMFMEIYTRVRRLMKEKPDTPLPDIVMEVVNSPAPKFYLQDRCAMDIIYKIKSGFYDTRKTILDK